MENNSSFYCFEVSKNDAGSRFDVFLAKSSGFSRNRIQKLISEGLSAVNGLTVPNDYRIKEGDRIEFEVPEPAEAGIIAQDIPLDIVFEDDHIVVLDKPAGLVVHPAPGNPDGTLVNAILFRVGDLKGIGDELRPGIVHRLDKDTTGLMIVAKSQSAHEKLIEMMSMRSVKRIYLSLVKGKILEKGEVNVPIGRDYKNRKRMAVNGVSARDAVTLYRPVETFKECTLMMITLGTGRTHQIRVHMASIGNPVLGDSLYSRYGNIEKELGVNRQMLHSNVIEFNHPISSEKMRFLSEPPKDMSSVIRMLRNEQNSSV